MHLFLQGLQCERTTRGEGKDEIYLVARKLDVDSHGNITATEYGTIWEHQMDEGDSRRIGWGRPFTHTIEIELWERDRVGSDEHIDTFQVVLERPVAGRRNPYNFTGHGAIYRLHYDLTEEAESNDYVLELGVLHCGDAQEREDEPYLTVNGVTVWGPVPMRTGRDVNVNTHVPFHGTAELELWEHDPYVSERFGSQLLYSVPVSTTVTFSCDRGIVGDATYTLGVRVRHA
ncbi:MAG: hypothetical protein U0531_03770 [Dehalococcoidia bacterium]